MLGKFVSVKKSSPSLEYRIPCFFYGQQLLNFIQTYVDFMHMHTKSPTAITRKRKTTERSLRSFFRRYQETKNFNLTRPNRGSCILWPTWSEWVLFILMTNNVFIILHYVITDWQWYLQSIKNANDHKSFHLSLSLVFLGLIKDYLQYSTPCLEYYLCLSVFW